MLTEFITAPGETEELVSSTMTILGDRWRNEEGDERAGASVDRMEKAALGS